MNFEDISRMAVAAVGAFALAGPALAGERPTGVVELFTSQGCSSCPPADALFNKLAAESDIIALSYHVDYWDYLGWRDTLATSDNTARQYEYGKSFGIRSVYTPQAVINGRVHVNGADSVLLDRAISKLADANEGMSVDLKVSQVGESFMIDAGAASGPITDAHLMLVSFDARQPVVIERGENTGNTVTYVNAVSKIQTAGMWHGEAMRFEVPASEVGKTDGCAALLQAVDSQGLPGAIIGATIVRAGTVH